MLPRVDFFTSSRIPNSWDSYLSDLNVTLIDFLPVRYRRFSMLLDRDDLDQPVRRTPPDLRYGHILLQCSVSGSVRSICFCQCWGSVSAGSACFWASRIRIHKSEVRIRLRIRILLLSGKNSKKNLDSYCFLTSL